MKEFRKNKASGYMYFYDPSHYCANSSGIVMEHIYVMAEHIGRPLVRGECVHHKDRDRSNNDISNLQLMTISEHTRLHMREDRGIITVNRQCLVCSGNFICRESSSRKYCSNKCSGKSSEKFEVADSDLEAMVWEMPTTWVAEIFGVSDVAIAKRCKKAGIIKPPRGYWAKLGNHSSFK
ncbi:HNH homing endonuclease [Stenotrophomonas phage SOVA965]